MTGKCIWLTGLSGAGKSTIAEYVAEHVYNSVILDGDVLRDGLCSDLGFTVDDRNENIRRIAHVAKLLYDQGHVVICAFISPMVAERNFARSLFPEGDFYEVYVECPLPVCEQRDPKGLYKQVRAGNIQNFTGIDSPYEIPLDPELTVITDEYSVEECAQAIMNMLEVEDLEVPRHVFVGRWSPFHKGHLSIIEAVLEDDPKPVLILVRNTLWDDFTASDRQRMVELGLQERGIDGEVVIIPDICSVNWGRGVGYATNCIEVPEDIQSISGTETREKMAAGDDSWKEAVLPSVAEYIEEFVI